MLQKLNERIQGVVSWLVIILIVLTFTLFGVDYYMQSHQSVDAKVFVNGIPISNQSFEVSYRRTRAQQEMAQLTAADEKQLKDQVLNQLITNEVTVQSAHKLGFEVSKDQANSAIVRIPQFQEDGHFSAQKYQQALSGALFTPESFQKEVQQGMLLNQQRFGFIGSSFALPDEINRFVRLYLQTRDYDYLVIPASKFVKESTVSEEEIKKYYKEHQSEFKSPEQVSLSYILLSMNDIRSSTHISESEVKRYYEENQSNFLTPSQWKVAHILIALPPNPTAAEDENAKNKAQTAYDQLQKTPADFGKLVRTLSDDKLSFVNNGELPWIIAGHTEYNNVLATLTTPGQISSPQKTKHGYEIFKLIEYKPSSVKPLDEVKNTIHQQLVNDLAQTQYTQKLEQLSDLSYQTPDTLDSVSDALNIPIQKTELFSRSGGKKGITGNKNLVSVAFSNDVLELGNNSEPIQLDNDSVVVVRINKHIQPALRSFITVKKEISDTLEKQYAQFKAKEVGAQLLNPANKKNNEIIQKYQLKWISVNNASRDHDKDDLLVNDLAFNLLRPDSRDGVITQNGDYVVVNLKKINDGNLDVLDKEQRDSLVQQIEASYGMMDYDLYVNSLVKQAQVVR